MNVEKIKGMLRGVIVGDAIGAPVETWESTRIASTYGRVDKMLVPDGHKWFAGEPAGSWTDDTQLTLAVAAGGLDMNTQVQSHIDAFKSSTKGWGNATRESVRRLANGASWESSGQSDGKGNGVAMKISPLAIHALNSQGQAIDFTIKLAAMTHKTSIGVSSGLAQMLAVKYCLESTPETFDPEMFLFQVCSGSSIGEIMFTETLDQDNLTDRLDSLNPLLQAGKLTDNVVENFGGGSCYVFNSLPFTYAFFLNNYKTIDSLYDVVNAGGDTDSNGSMLAALLGALHGPDIFPKHLTNGLVVDQLAIVDQTADTFCKKFLV